jgi:hypothetical protein
MCLLAFKFVKVSACFGNNGWLDMTRFTNTLDLFAYLQIMFQLSINNRECLRLAEQMYNNFQTKLVDIFPGDAITSQEAGSAKYVSSTTVV